MQALNSQGVASLNTHTYALFRSKLVPGAPVQELPGVFDTLTCDIDFLDQLIHRMDSGSKGGLDLLHNGILIQLWDHPNSATFRAALIKVINKILNGQLLDNTMRVLHTSR